MAKIEVKEVKATMTEDNMEPHWVAVVDYGFTTVEIPLPARQLAGDDFSVGLPESIEAIKSLATAPLRFAETMHPQLPK
jgi:hypothetical protein